jgi:hypothetical protein
MIVYGHECVNILHTVHYKIIFVECPGDETILFHQTQHRRCSHYSHLKKKAEMAFRMFHVLILDDGRSPKIIV